MLAPPGPVRTEALRFTLDKPPAGARTMTCVSTVSPRALYRLMEEAVPGMSVCPTLARPDITHTGNGEPDVVLKGMEIIRTTVTATSNITPLKCRKVQRTSAPARRPDFAKIFMGVFLLPVNS